jgi:mannose-6-phosphate isomerase-like protein (cupin superfamily)
MRKINVGELADETWTGPDGHSIIRGKEISEALGRDPKSEDPLKRHPFDVEIQYVPAGSEATYLHSHSLQWEFYHVISGGGTVESADGIQPIAPGDAFLFRPGEIHRIRAGEHDLALYVIADNPIGDKGTIV